MDRSVAIDPYPPVERWILPRVAVEATLDAVRGPGRDGRESGAFWLGTRSPEARVKAIVFPRGAGVEEHPYLWRVSADVYGVVSTWAKPRGMSLLGVVHTHISGVPARLSQADRKRSVKAPGVLAVVIGNGGLDRDSKTWGWYVYDSGYERLHQTTLDERVVVQNAVTVVLTVADLDGVRPWES